jgi:hypothetical protein
MSAQVDPGRVVLAAREIVVVTDCCRARMGLSRERVDLVLTQVVVCPGCQQRRRLDFLSDARVGLRAVWSNPPAHSIGTA